MRTYVCAGPYGCGGRPGNGLNYAAGRARPTGLTLCTSSGRSSSASSGPTRGPNEDFNGAYSAKRRARWATATVRALDGYNANNFTAGTPLRARGSYTERSRLTCTTTGGGTSGATPSAGLTGAGVGS